MVTIPKTGRSTTQDSVVLDAADIIHNEYETPQGERNLKLDFIDAKGYIKNIGKNENIFLVSHGGAAYRGMGKDGFYVHDLPRLGKLNPITLADYLIKSGLPKNYSGNIFLSACNTAVRGDSGEDSFLEEFSMEMLRNDYKNLSISGNLGKAASKSGLKGRDMVRITDTKLSKGFPSSDSVLKIQIPDNGGVSLIDKKSVSPLGFAEYRKGNIFIPGADDNLEYFPGQTNALNRRFSMEDTEDGFTNITDEEEWDFIKSENISPARTYEPPKPKKKGLFSKAKSFWSRS